MAIEIRINPLDFEPDVALGIDLPMMAGTGAAFKLNYLSIDQAVANAKNLLLTEKGERIMQPEFGCGLRKHIFENIEDDLTESIRENIIVNFDYWLPYIFINDIQVVPNEDYNRIRVTLTISLKGNQIDTRSIQVEITMQ